MLNKMLNMPQTPTHKKTGKLLTYRFIYSFLGWMMGLEPTTTETTTQCSTS